MKHLYILFLIGLFLINNTNAQYVITPETAALVGSNFLTRYCGIHHQKSETPQLSLAYTAISRTSSIQKAAASTPCYYAFNVKGGGFVLVSATKSVHPILAYAQKEGFDTAELPANLKAYLRGLQAEITEVIHQQYPTTSKVKTQWERLETTAAIENYNENTTAVEPLTENILWDQGVNFNDSCPKDAQAGNGGRCPVGCTATAMGIVMRYWKYPAHGYGSNTYNTSKYGTLSANFENTNYNYDNMPEYFGLFPKANQRAAVSQLLYHCGVSVNMGYSPNSSGAYVYTNWNSNAKDALNAFRNNFGYSHAEGAQKKDYSNDQWIALLKKELQHKRPVICSGYPKSGAGHAFVCDGYDANNLFHFNWGWGGRYNCYCLVDRLIPEGYGIGGEGGDFSYNQSIVYNISPYLEEYNKGWISSKAFNTVSPKQYLLNLQPDTCMRIYEENGSSAAHVHSIGTLFNPTAAVFGNRNTQQLFRHPYRLDSLRIRCNYTLGSLHDSTDDPDTLYIYLAYYQDKDTNYRISTVDGRQFLCPAIDINPIRPMATNTVCIRYLLTPTDADRSALTIPMNYAGASALGFDVPEDASLQVMLRFVPGYSYQNGDTLARISDGKTKALHNSFTLHCWESQNIAEISAKGYNTALMEGSLLRYQEFKDSAENRYYMPSGVLLPQWEYHLRVNTRPTAAYIEKDTVVCGDTKWNQLWITQDGDYRQILKAADGRDSVVVLHATYDQPIGEMGKIQGIKKIQRKGSFTFEIEAVKDADHYRWELDSKQWQLENPDSLKCTLVVPARGKGVLTANAYSAHGGCHQNSSMRFIYCDSLKSIPGIHGQNVFYGPSLAIFSMDSLFEAQYKWYLSKNSQWKINGDSTQRWVLIDISSSNFDSLYVDVCDECGNISTRSIGIACILGMPQTEDQWQTSIYPNPTADEVHAVYDANKGNCSYRLSDAYGRLIRQGACNGNSLKLSLRDCAAGMYFLQLRNAKQQSSIYKIVKQ